MTTHVLHVYLYVTRTVRSSIHTRLSVYTSRVCVCVCVCTLVCRSYTLLPLFSDATTTHASGASRGSFDLEPFVNPELIQFAGKLVFYSIFVPSSVDMASDLFYLICQATILEK